MALHIPVIHYSLFLQRNDCTSLSTDTVKPVYNDSLYDEIYYLCFIQ